VSYDAMLIVVVLAAFAVANVAMSGVAALLWRAARRDPDRLSPAARARGLFLVRLLPAGASLVLVAGVVLPAFHAFEPRGHDEAIGASLLALSVFGVLLVAGAAVRGWLSARATRRLVRAWMAQACPITLAGATVPAVRVESAFPLVAVVGLVRPRLLVAQRVLDACTPQELGAIVAHEAGHVATFDNLKRLLMRAAPDLLAFTPAGPAIEHDWADAAEEAADDHAARTAGGRALDLAGALVKVARMLPGGTHAALPASTLCHNETVERRVRRLLNWAPGGSGAPWLFAARGLVPMLVAVAAAGAVDVRLLVHVQRVVEIVVSSLP
jgi:hypothetical protein